MKKLLLFTILLASFAFQGCMQDQEDNVGSLQVETQVFSVNEPRWHAAQEIQYYVSTEKGFYEGNHTANWANSFRQGTFHRKLEVADLLPGNYVIGFYERMETGNDRYNHLQFQIIGGRTTNLTLR